MALPDKAIEELLSMLLQRAAKIYEESYRNDGKGYTIHLSIACNNAVSEVGCSTELALLLYILLDNDWDNSLDWAESIRRAIHGPRH